MSTFDTRGLEKELYGPSATISLDMRLFLSESIFSLMRRSTSLTDKSDRSVAMVKLLRLAALSVSSKLPLFLAELRLLLLLRAVSLSLRLLLALS